MSLYTYLTSVRKMNINYHPDLEVQIKVSNEQEAMDEYVNPRRKTALKSSTSNAIIKEKAYYPIVPTESFLTVSSNDFPVEACTQHRNWIETNDFKALRVELYKDPQTGIVMSKPSDRMPVTDFPVEASTDKTGVICIIEPPTSDDPPHGLYVAGIDPYKSGESDWSDSLGSVYIVKRMTTNMTEAYQNMPVAWYTARPKNEHEWYENVRMLLKYYNATAMCENLDYGFIQYMISKNETEYLAQGLSFLKEISPGTKHKGQFGLPPTPAMISHWNSTLNKYANEEVVKEYDENGKAMKTILGVTRILDPILLTEMIKFNKNKGNFDRVRAFAIALAYAQQLDAIMPPINVTYDPPKKEKYIRSPFGGFQGGLNTVHSPFTGGYKRGI